MTDLKLEHLNIPATDPEGLASWYAKSLGLEANKHVVRGPGVIIAFEQGEPINRGPEVHIGFRAQSIDALKDWAKKFDTEVSIGPEFTTFRTPDPEGNCLEFYAPNA